MTDYPLIKQMGLTVSQMKLVNADDLERAIAAAPVVYGYKSPIDGWFLSESKVCTPGRDTRTARLLCVTPIKKDDAVSLLKEILPKLADSEYAVWQANWMARVEKLLASIGESK